MASSLHCPKICLSDVKKQKQVEAVLAPLILSQETVSRIRKTLEEQMELGLARNPASTSCLQMENTFIPELPDGNECGDFLALDLGGTNFRVILLKLQPGTTPYDLVQYYTVPEPLRLGEGPPLFNFLAECIYDFAKKENLLDRRLPLGFCFSFPMVQRGLDVGILVTWTKSFNCSGVVGKDAAQMLRDAIDKIKDLKVDVVAIINDTTGTLMKGAYLDSRCAIGLILGTGCNACYLERVDRIEKWEGEHPGIEEVVVDIEWGAFGDNGVLDFIKTEYDRAVDAGSLLVNSFTFEKLFAGKFLGELVRQVLLRLVHKGLMLRGKATRELLTHSAVTTSDVSAIEGDDGATEARKVLQRLQYDSIDDNDIAIFRYVCAVTSVRGAKIVSTCLSSLLDHMAKPDVTIAIDGSLYKNHPKFHTMMMDFIRQMTRKDIQFRLMLAEDGSGKGAGMVAAVAARLRSRQQK